MAKPPNTNRPEHRKTFFFFNLLATRMCLGYSHSRRGYRDSLDPGLGDR